MVEIMRKMLIVVAVLGLGAAHAAEPSKTVEDAVSASERGDYATAMRLFRPLAENLDAIAQYFLGELHDKAGAYRRIMARQSSGTAGRAHEGSPLPSIFSVLCTW